MHKAFWDVLEEEIKAEPPQFKNAFNLLIEMKTVSKLFCLKAILIQIAFKQFSKTVKKLSKTSLFSSQFSREMGAY